ncbi:MAG: guanylate kinase [Myxococcales bacterium]|nr:guanylate kinase [Myxococcales bacterium]
MVLLILAACSGTGKSTLGRHLRAMHPKLRLSVSHTTRAPRPGEAEGVDYHFVDRAAFEADIERGRFVEWAEYAGNLYGTARSTLEAAAAAGHDLLFDVEVVGAANLKRACPEAVSCFLLPPTWAEVERRLRARGTETEATLARRLATGRRELAEAHTFDYLVINDVLADAVADLDAVYRAAGQRTPERLPLLDALRQAAGPA